MNDEQRRAYTLAHNKTTMNSGFDIPMLNDEIQDMEIDMLVFGFIDPDNIIIDVNDNDFLKDTEITKSKEPKKIVCPNCGQVVEI